jgi:hypothetical protein
MDPSTRVIINGSQIVSEIIDGEAILINLDTGKYYSLQDAGADIWAAVQEGVRIDKMLDDLAAKYAGERDAIQSSVLSLLNEMREEDLIATQEAPAGDDVGPVADAGGEAPERIPFEAPVLQKYTDMQDLLLLDPIHEVDASGWPKTVGDAGESA